MNSSRRELGALFRLAWPMITTQLFIMATGFLDTAMAGQYNAVDLAAVALAGNVMWPLFMLTSGITMALTPIVAQMVGAKETEHSGVRIRQGLWIALASSALLVICLNHTEWLFVWAGIDAEVTRIAQDYLAAVSWGIPPVMLYVALRNTSEGLGHTIPPMVIAGSVLPLNAALNYGLIYGEFGLSELGGVGCGYATAIVFWTELLLMMFVVRRPFFRATGAFSKFSGPKLSEIWRIVQVGLPIGLTMFVEMAVFAVIGFLIGRIGVVELAAHSIAGNLNWLTYVIPSTLGAAAGIRVGFYVGSGNFAGARLAAATAYRFALSYAIVVSVLLILLRHVLVQAYSQDPAVLEMAATLLIFIAVYQIVDDTQAVAGGTLRGYKDTRMPMVYGLVGYWLIALPLGYVLAFQGLGPLEPSGVYGFWGAMTFGLALVAVAITTRLYRTANSDERIQRFAVL